MSEARALLTVSIGPVHTFIAQARRVADLWAGSSLLSHLIKTAIGQVLSHGNGYEMLFPHVGAGPIPGGLPNRFVCRVPEEDATACANRVATAIRDEWRSIVGKAVDELAKVGITPHASIWPGTPTRPGQADAAIEIAWSWVPETGGYRAASDAGARQFAASRMYRPFAQIHEPGRKCAVCGERTALPDGDPKRVRQHWDQAEERAQKELTGFFRKDQTKLCLVCATKRLFPVIRGEQARFASFQDFEPRAEDRENDDRQVPYFAVVSMDGDKLGQALAGAGATSDSDLEAFHRDVSTTLTDFANSLRSSSPALNVKALQYDIVGSKAPQLIYAGGEDVVFICDPRDAIPLARKVREHYSGMFEGKGTFTISAAVLFAHTKYPAGLLFREVEELLVRKAKRDAGRDAIAIRLRKRGGVPVEVAFQWDDGPDGASTSWLDLLHGRDGLVALLQENDLASRQSFILVDEARRLHPVFNRERDLWLPWLTKSLSRGEGSSANAADIAGKLAPLFIEEKKEALRIARFIAVEVPV